MVSSHGSIAWCTEPGWRNGRRGGLKIRWAKARGGSSPPPGTRDLLPVFLSPPCRRLLLLVPVANPQNSPDDRNHKTENHDPSAPIRRSASQLAEYDRRSAEQKVDHVVALSVDGCGLEQDHTPPLRSRVSVHGRSARMAPSLARVGYGDTQSGCRLLRTVCLENPSHEGAAHDHTICRRCRCGGLVRG